MAALVAASLMLAATLAVRWPGVAAAASPSAVPSPTASPEPAGLAMDARALLQGHARPGSWMAISVGLSNDGPPIVGELRLVGGTQNLTRFSVPVDLPTTSRKSYSLYVQAPAFGQTTDVALVVDEKIVARRQVAFALHDVTQLVVGVVAEKPGNIVAALNRTIDPSSPRPAVVALVPSDLPSRPEAWAPLDRLVWQDVDAGQLTTEQLAALRTWVAAGGRLTIVGGSAGTGVLGGFPDELLPYRPATTLDVDPSALIGLVGGSVPAGAAAIPALAGELIHGRALASSGDRTIAAEASYGSGGTALVGFDPTSAWLADSARGDAVWARIVPSRTSQRTPFLAADDSPLVNLLSTLPSLALPSIEGLLALLLAYILLVGPVNYLVLRRLDRREWAWLSIPLLIVGFTGAAFAIGATLRGSEVIVNQVAVVRAAPGTDAAQATVYLGVFSPSRSSYDVTVGTGALLSAPLNDPTGQSAGQGLDVVQADPASVRQLSVGYGTLRAIRAEAPVSAPSVTGTLRLEGGRLKGTLKNASSTALASPAVVFGQSVATLPDLAPGASADIDVAVSSTQFGASLSDRIFGQMMFDPTTGQPATDFARQSVRRQLVDALTYDPFSGMSGTLPSDGPVLLAWGLPGLLDVKVTGQAPRLTGETLYYVPLPLTASGPVVFTPDLIRTSMVESKAQFFSKDPFTVSLGGGSVTIAYRPASLDGTFSASRLILGLNTGNPYQLPAPTGSVTPGPLRPGSGPSASPSPAASPTPGPGGFPRLPGIELLDITAGGWRQLPDLPQGVSVTVDGGARFVDPSSGTVLVRFTNSGVDSTGFQFSLQLEGTVR